MNEQNIHNGNRIPFESKPPNISSSGNNHKVHRSKADLFAVIIIIIISGSGFIAGYFQNQYGEEVKYYNDLATKAEQNSDQMYDLMQYWIEHDRALYDSASRAFEEVYVNSLEWLDLLNPALNISSEQMYIINTTHLIPIQTALFRAIGYLNDSLVHDLYMSFTFLEPEEDYYLASEIVEGYEFVIPYSDWLSKNLYSIEPMEQFLNTTLVDCGFPPETNMLQRILSDAPEYVFRFEIGKLHDLLFDIFLNEREKAFLYRDQSILAKDLLNKVSLGVSVTTVAIVLSTAMSNRIEQKKYFATVDRLRADIYHNEELISSKSDRIAIPVLILAVGISLAGLILVFL
ncbi:hypothetical protein [Candidatus Harpocratesius sp.]